MSIAIAQAISGFPSGEPQSADLVTVPASLLNQIIEEIQDLKAQRDQDRQELEALRQELREARVYTAALRIDDTFEALDALEGRINKLEGRIAEPTQKTRDHIDALVEILSAYEQRYRETGHPSYRSILVNGMSFSRAAVVLKVTPERVSQLAKIAASDPRLNVSWSPQRKNAKVFKLRRWTDKKF